MSTAVGVRCTPEEYLALERKADERSEYFDGCIRPMARSNHNHSLISGNLLASISRKLLHRPEEVYGIQMRTRIGPTGPYTYPDVVAVAERPRFEDSETDVLLNPAVIAEVFSPATEAFDRGEKFASYRRLESLREYVLVAQDRVRVERFARRGDEWLLTEFNSLDDVLRLDSIACDVPIREVYAKTPMAGGSRGIAPRD